MLTPRDPGTVPHSDASGSSSEFVGFGGTPSYCCCLLEKKEGWRNRRNEKEWGLVCSQRNRGAWLAVATTFAEERLEGCWGCWTTRSEVSGGLAGDQK